MTDDMPPAPTADHFPLKDLKTGAPDKRGRMVTDVLWAVRDFKIYKTDKGISPQFSDTPDEACKQRQAYMSLGPELAELGQQIDLLKNGWARWITWIWRRLGARDDPQLAYCERETARGIAQALDGDPDAGRQTLAELSRRISKRLGNMLRVLYFTICAIAAFEITIGLAIYTSRLEAPETATVLGLNIFQLSVAAVMGCLGALLSTAIGLRNLAIDPAATLTMNITYAVQRMLVGTLGAMVLHITLKSGIAGALLGTAASNSGGEDMIYKLSFVSLLAGFSERLVPNLLEKSAEKYGDASDATKPAPSSAPPATPAAAP
ncbi:hypothetical protein NUH88_01945 [Nisaea acidiphila]|uniref:Uncharacterized protein n=1 Tax=Nisaea acidiphila TaxID=1862145 RepID=A0A9J7ATG4_9PROT|nr:hypothetical protein [Nisaea acidiphila]UUX50462.1 hypothetical protein NUH88_01945 [Nisaea acidiphila]